MFPRTIIAGLFILSHLFIWLGSKGNAELANMLFKFTEPENDIANTDFLTKDKILSLRQCQLGCQLDLHSSWGTDSD
jgi:hypothetical protein